MKWDPAGYPPVRFNICNIHRWIMSYSTLRKNTGIPIDHDFIEEVRRISMRRKGLIIDDEIQ